MCLFHKWSKWERKDNDNCEIIEQRFCLKCNKSEYRKVGYSHDWGKWEYTECILKYTYQGMGIPSYDTTVGRQERVCTKCGLVELEAYKAKEK